MISPVVICVSDDTLAAYKFYIDICSSLQINWSVWRLYISTFLSLVKLSQHPWSEQPCCIGVSKSARLKVSHQDKGVLLTFSRGHCRSCAALLRYLHQKWNVYPPSCWAGCLLLPLFGIVSAEVSPCLRSCSLFLVPRTAHMQWLSM